MSTNPNPARSLSQRLLDQRSEQGLPVVVDDKAALALVVAVLTSRRPTESGAE